MDLETKIKQLSAQSDADLLAANASLVKENIHLLAERDAAQKACVRLREDAQFIVDKVGTGTAPEFKDFVRLKSALMNIPESLDAYQLVKREEWVPKWRPIATAPDNCRVLVRKDGFGLVRIDVMLNAKRSEHATHWMPLPSPALPASETKGTT